MASEQIHSLAPIHGIDIEAGLAVVRGNQALYPRLLHKFAERYENFEALFRRARNAVGEDPDSARRTAHLLTGLAAILGALRLSDLAYKLEKSCHAHASDLEQRLQDLVAGLTLILQQLSDR